MAFMAVWSRRLASHLGLGVVLAATLVCHPAKAQVWPSKPVRIITSTSPGGVTDLISRAIGQLLTEALGQNVVVENRPGAGTFIGMTACARAEEDGHTLCITDNQSLVYNPLLFTRLPYDPDRDFAPVGVIARSNGGVIVAHAATPGNTFQEVMSHAREHPGTLNFATWGPGSVPAIYYAWITRQNGVNITAVPYTGAGPSMLALTAGQVQLAYSNVGIARPLLEAGRLKILAMTGVQRHPQYPQIPSLGELGSDPAMDTFFALYAPARTPAAIVKRLSSELARAVRTPRFQALARDNSLVPVGNTPEEFAVLLRDTRANAARVFQTIGIKPLEAPQDAPAVPKSGPAG